MTVIDQIFHLIDTDAIDYWRVLERTEAKLRFADYMDNEGYEKEAKGIRARLVKRLTRHLAA